MVTLFSFVSCADDQAGQPASKKPSSLEAKTVKTVALFQKSVASISYNKCCLKIHCCQS